MFTIGLTSSFWLPLDTGPADVELRAEARPAFQFPAASIRNPVDPGTATIGSR